MKDHPDYQYRPRKPSEKPRRMTKKKAEALALMTVISGSPSPGQDEDNTSTSLLLTSHPGGIFPDGGIPNNNGALVNPNASATNQHGYNLLSNQAGSQNPVHNNTTGFMNVSNQQYPHQSILIDLQMGNAPNPAAPNPMIHSSSSARVDAAGWTPAMEARYLRDLENEQWAAVCRMDELEEEFLMMNAEAEGNFGNSENIEFQTNDHLEFVELSG